MEVRQLRYFVTVAEELHFGRAAEREHIVQSGLSQQIRRLERDVGARLLDRNTHQVTLTPAGTALLFEARQILVRIDRAGALARRAATEADVLRIGITDTSYDLAPCLVDTMQEQCPDLEIRQYELGIPAQYELLARGKLDVGIGASAAAPSEISSEALRRDPAGVFVSDSHRFARLRTVPASALEREALLLADADVAPEYNRFVYDLCERAGFVPTAYRGTVQSVHAAIDLVKRRDCLLVCPRSVWRGSPGVRWVPVVEPLVTYTWSVLWHAESRVPNLRRFVMLARAHARSSGWLRPGSLAAS